MNKYGNRKIKTHTGDVFDSKKEARRYAELLLMEKGGHIRELRRQVKFELIPAQYGDIGKDEYLKSNGKKTKGKCLERSVTYIADFTYYTYTGEYVVEDTKGMKTKDYIIKRKLMLYRFGIKIQEV